MATTITQVKPTQENSRSSFLGNGIIKKLAMMYNFVKQREAIIYDGLKYGVKIKVVDNGSLHGLLELDTNVTISDSVRKFLTRRINT